MFFQTQKNLKKRKKMFRWMNEDIKCSDCPRH